MKNSIKYFAIFTLFFCTGRAFAQTGFSEKVTKFAKSSSQSAGNDFWFAPILNDTAGAGSSPALAYIRLYISSLTNTTAFVECNGVQKSVPVPAYSAKDSLHAVATFDVPLAWEMTTSGITENKAIHVWSSSSNLSVYLISHIPYSSDGMYCIPTQDLGTDYVVAGYESLFEGFGTYVYDYPSEFTITAPKDNTIVYITPSCDLRESDSLGKNDSIVAYPKSTQFSVILNQGQSIQFQAVKAQDADNYDVTGTVIHSNNPVGVVGGSTLSNIPPDFPYGDFIMDMIPPISAWGKTYYATNPVQPQGMTGHDFALYCMVSSVPNQTIYRQDNATGKHTEATLGPTYDHYYVEEESANKFSSNQPFLLVQYFNSESYPDGTNGNGNPAELVINPVENFTDSVLFVASAIVGSQAPYDNYANVTIRAGDEAGTTFDGRKISSYSFLPIDDSFKIYTIPHISAGVHLVASDIGVGVSAYGYGNGESYAWAGSLGSTTLHSAPSTDSVPPSIAFVIDNLCMKILLSDSGNGISRIAADSSSNISFSIDPAFVSGTKSTYANLCVIDSFKSDSTQVLVTDLAGNVSIATIIYKAPVIVSSPGFTLTAQSFDTVLVNTIKSLPILKVTDTSTLYPITITRIWTNAPEFIFDRGVAANNLPLTLAPLESHSFTIGFYPGRDSVYGCTLFAVSDSTGDQPTTIERVVTLRGIGYSVAPAGVANESQTKVCAALTPNPATESVSLNFSLPQTSDVTFELNSIDGKKVFNWNTNNESEGEHIENIDISSLAQGSYIYNFNANGQTQSGKLIINR